MRGYSLITSSFALFVATPKKRMEHPAFVIPNVACHRDEEESPPQAPSMYDEQPDVQVVSDSETSVSQTASTSFLQRDPLRFEFRGYSIWLELEQVDNDLDRAIEAAASAYGIVPIPAPHVTVFYGISHLTESEARHRFCSKLSDTITSWPALKTKGVLADVSYDGVDGEEMDMAWVELTLKSSPQHESLLQTVGNIFFDKHDKVATPLSGSWLPHLSLAYDNPESSPLDLKFVVDLLERYPTLMTIKERKVSGISLWSNVGKIQEWHCLERIDF